jgi:hypothetical protein
MNPREVVASLLKINAERVEDKQLSGGANNPSSQRATDRPPIKSEDIFQLESQ